MPLDILAVPPPPPTTAAEWAEVQAVKQAADAARLPQSIRDRRAAMQAAAQNTILATVPTRGL
jgi:hypothetical protein